MTAPDDADTFDEWRVTGEPGPVPGYPGVSFPPYRFVWSKYQGPDRDDPERAARQFIGTFRGREPWADGPYLWYRTVTHTTWKLIIL